MTNISLQEQHIALCAQDIARIARLILAGEEQHRNLHATFVRQASTARRYNREALPALAIDVETLLNAALSDTAQNFRAVFAEAQAGPRLDGTDKAEIARRVLADSSPYLDPVMKWMERNRTAGTFSQYSDPARAIRVLRQIPMIQLRSEEELGALITQGMKPAAA